MGPSERILNRISPHPILTGSRPSSRDGVLRVDWMLLPGDDTRRARPPEVASGIEIVVGDWAGLVVRDLFPKL